MKVFIAILMIATLVHADEDWKVKTANEIDAIRTECLKEHNLDPEVITQIQNFELPDTEAVRQYVLCCAEKVGVFCTHEGYHPERLTKQFKLDLDESEVLAIAQGCADKNEQGSPVDVWAFRGHICLVASKVGDRVKAYVKQRIAEAEKST